jgi:hypothetical protein
MNQLTLIQPAIKQPNNITQLSNADLAYLLDHARRSHHDLTKTLQENKTELIKLGREKARREGILFPPSFETILHPTPTRS